MKPVMAIHKWGSNGDLIADCARLGYLRAEWATLDPAYGYGTFWSVWRPDVLVAMDNNPRKAPHGVVDFRRLPFADSTFDAVVFDPPYKLNGNPSDTDGVDERYGVDQYTDWRARMQLIRDGLVECRRVYNGRGYLLLKCQDQVCSGQVRWQTFEFAELASSLGLRLVDRFDHLSYRAQPARRRQVHARHNSSTLLVFQPAKKER